jgi:serine/threonine protein kinase
VQAFGDYLLVERLSESKTGTVWKAQHRPTGGTVAVKMLSRAAMTSNTMVERFRRQVAIMAELVHPNLVISYEGGRLDGVPYLVMEYIEGQDLRSRVKQRGPLSVEEAVEYISQAAAGLGCAHARGIWHRNVKTGNLMVDRSGVIRVTGFGLAHVESEDEGNVALTVQGQAMGTGDYMAPEQALDSSSVDARADIYGLGCTLCMLLTGRPPYKAASFVQMVEAHLSAPIPSLRAARADVPVALDAVFQKMLAKRPEDRYRSMDEVVTALRGSLTGAGAWADLGPVLPAVAWPAPQEPTPPTVAWPAPQALAPSSAAWPAPQEPVLPSVAWPSPQEPALSADLGSNALWNAPLSSIGQEPPPLSQSLFGPASSAPASASTRGGCDAQQAGFVHRGGLHNTRADHAGVDLVAGSQADQTSGQGRAPGDQRKA